MPDRLFAAYYRDVYAYLYSLTRDAALSEDLAMDTFVEVVKSVGSFRGESDVKTWLFSIARHCWSRWLRRQKRSVRTELLTEFLPDAAASPEERSMDAFLDRRIRDLLGRESAQTREIVRMRLEGYSFYEIGQKYGISETSARVIDFRAKARIRSILEKEGLTRD
ncbi:MAG: sigma-70 family RNA polymerase sigma factor [Clostridia bacterium]|nr:sigma-70 family RNA polymerase sigma factor [Clostridia bacterium]